MPDPRQIQVMLVCALPDKAYCEELSLPPGTTVAAAIGLSGIRAAWPDIDICEDRLGIFARKVAPDAILRDGDRLEIYRPLRIDPKEARRQRARGA